MRLAELDGRRVGIWGFGREGRAALEAVRSRAADVHVHADDQDDPVRALGDRDVVIRSPGVSIYRPEVGELRARGVEFTTGTALWMAEVAGRAPVLGVTGTKGKSTTASLAAHLATAAGADARLGGNVGRPLIALLEEPPAELYVAELSSYQLADLNRMPTAGVVLNLYREHLDWHGSEERYFADKLRILDGATAVLNAGDPRLVAAAPEDARWFGDGRGFHLAGETIVDAGGEEVARADDLALRGEHNLLNACAALEGLAAVDVHPEAPAAALRSFRGLPHRLQRVAERDGLEWIDDSISTAPESAIAALRSFGDRPITLIAGGFDRGQDYTELVAEIVSRGATVVAVPKTGERLAKQVGDRVSVHAAAGLPEAVALARDLAPRPGVVLLSPAAPSFGAYRDFEERGQHFARLAAGM